MTEGPSPRSAWNATPAPCRLPALSPRNRSALFRGDLRCRDELRHPLLSPFKVLAVHRLELGRREGVRRGASAAPQALSRGNVSIRPTLFTPSRKRQPVRDGA